MRIQNALNIATGPVTERTTHPSQQRTTDKNATNALRSRHPRPANSRPPNPSSTTAYTLSPAHLPPTLRSLLPTLLLNHNGQPHNPQPSAPQRARREEGAPVPLARHDRAPGDEGRVSEGRHHEAEEAEFGTEEDGQGALEQWPGCQCLYPRGR